MGMSELSAGSVSIEIESWEPDCPGEAREAALSALESGAVVQVPRLSFRLAGPEGRFLSPQWSDGKSKNVSFDRSSGALSGARGATEDLALMRAMMGRFTDRATDLIGSLLPQYRSALWVARTSFRPVRVEGRRTSPLKDDGRLHTDAFPSRPTRGERILRVFTNVNPAGEPRVWQVGEPFEPFARRYLMRLRRPVPGAAAALDLLRITRGRRSEYDFLMLQLHDLAKSDSSYQSSAPRLTLEFAAGTTWIVFSDQVLHAVLSGQYVFEQTFHLPVSAMRDQRTSPLRCLERLCGRPLC
jgi:hypothetical protein